MEKNNHASNKKKSPTHNVRVVEERKAKIKKASKRNRAEDVHKKDEIPNSSNT